MSFIKTNILLIFVLVSIFPLRTDANSELDAMNSKSAEAGFSFISACPASAGFARFGPTGYGGLCGNYFGQRYRNQEGDIVRISNGERIVQRGCKGTCLGLESPRVRLIYNSTGDRLSTIVVEGGIHASCGDAEIVQIKKRLERMFAVPISRAGTDDEGRHLMLGGDNMFSIAVAIDPESNQVEVRIENRLVNVPGANGDANREDDIIVDDEDW